MTKRMLIDASHAEETRVVVLDGNRLEDFDVETSTKRQLKGNIYLAKVVRVEPSLQAAFVEYGGNRHGFLAFSEIHPDYYQIPVADRQRLIEMEAEEARLEEEEEDRAAGHPPARAEPRAASPAEPSVTVIAEAEAAAEPASDEAAAAAQAPEPPTAETGDESGATATMLEQPPAETAPAAPEPPTAETSDESGATGPMLEQAPAEAPQAASQPEPAAEAAAATPAPAPEPAAQSHAAGAEIEQAAAAPAQSAEPPQATATEPVEQGEAETGATPPGDETPPHDAPEPSGRRRRAQPMVIEPERVSGPVETSDASHDTAESAVAETVDESGATVAVLEAETEHSTVMERPERPRRNRRRSDEDESVAEEEAEFHDAGGESPPPETLGGEQDSDDRGERRLPPRFLRNYRIQEVIKRRQIMLVQVVKEERGTKGAALTTYISLAGRFSVLMPNSPRGGGISRKITSATDRRRLKEIVTEMDMPKGMGLIVRTAGANRPKPEIKRDCEYLLRLWDDIREHTLKSVAPAVIYEEASLIKRAIRDVYSRDIDEITVDGEEGWRQAHEFMRMLMPSHAKKVQLWRDGGQPLFARYQVEAQLDNMLLPTVQLRSGGYLVINQTEALVAIDVNSGRSTRERNVEETALRTNLEAADEAARQLRLRDLAGLIVIDFIDMESRKHNAMVEKRLKEALKNDRARIQVGHISHFGLLEMSRQRLRPSLAETSFIPCPHCGGTGHIRSTESAALHVLRGIEEEGSKRRAAEIVVHVATPIALYILNHKRDRLHEIELRYAMRVTIAGDDRQIEPQFRIDRLRPQTATVIPAVITPDLPPPLPPEPAPAPEVEEEEAPVAVEEAEPEETAEATEDAQAEAGGELSAEEAERRRRRRRRRRRGRRDDVPTQAAEPGEAKEGEPEAEHAPEPQPAEVAASETLDETHIEGVPEHAEVPSAEDDEDARGRRRGRRGGRRRRREPGERETTLITPDTEQPDLPPVYTGPTPANPFGGHAFDIFDMLEQAEGAAARPPAPIEIRPGASAAPEHEAAIVNTAAPEPAAEEPVAPLAAAEGAEGPQGPVELQPGVPEAGSAAPAAAAAPDAPNAAAAWSLQIPEPAHSDEPPAAEPAEEPPRAASEGTAEAVTDAPAEGQAEAAAPSLVDLASPPVIAEQEPPAEERPAEPAIKPIVIGSAEEPPAEKKRGWWRRG